MSAPARCFSWPLRRTPWVRPARVVGRTPSRRPRSGGGGLAPAGNGVGVATGARPTPRRPVPTATGPRACSLGLCFPRWLVHTGCGLGWARALLLVRRPPPRAQDSGKSPAPQEPPGGPPRSRPHGTGCLTLSSPFCSHFLARGQKEKGDGGRDSSRPQQHGSRTPWDAARPPPGTGAPAPPPVPRLGDTRGRRSSAVPTVPWNIRHGQVCLNR